MRKVLICVFLVFSLALTVSANEDRIVDNADLLTQEEEAILEEMAAGFVTDWGMDAVIVTCDSLDGKSAESYADDYFEYNGYGVGPEYSGTLLLVSMNTREWAISTCGEAIGILDDVTLDYIADRFLPYLSDGEYADAFQVYFSCLEDAYRQPHTLGDPDTYEEPLDAGDIAVRIVFCLVIGCLAGGITVYAMSRSMNTARPQSGAIPYLENGLDLTRRQDIFLYSHTSRTRRAESSSGGGGSGRSSSTHRSSSGRSHGGRSGRF